MDWGSVAAWAQAVRTALVVITTSLVALGFFERFRAPQVRLSFEHAEPWCRLGGVPRSRTFDPIELRPGQREYLNVLLLPRDDDWHLVTSGDPDFDPGVATTLPREARHHLQVSVFSSNAATSTRLLVAQAGPRADHLTLHLALPQAGVAHGA